MLTTLITLSALSKFSTTHSANEIVIDASKRTSISSYIYGVNYPDTFLDDWLHDWTNFHHGFTLAREGGNRFTAYNWETNASNAGNDYFFENDDYLEKSDEPGLAVLKFLRAVQETGSAALLTVPTLGYVAADKGPNTDTKRDVNLTPDYLNKRFVKSFASKPAGKLIYPPDPKDGAVYQDEFVSWVETAKSKKTPVWFTLDNEPDLWHSTHLRIAPKAPNYADIIGNNIEYATAIKRVAPDTLVFGPCNYGWYGFRAFQGAPDANGRIFVDAYLDALSAASKKAGKRLLDVYDFHWYPEAMGGGVRIIYNQAPDKPETVQARIQAPRSLWDPTYVEDSWIPKSNGNKPIELLPDFQTRIASHFPGTKLSITEYDFGGRNVISGALAQADALGVFGRQGLFAACHWGLNEKDVATYAGFRAFTDYDRKGSRFGDLGLAVSGESPADDSAYASLDSKDRNRMVAVIINKVSSPRQFHVTTKGFRTKSAQAYVIREGVYGVPETSEVLVAGDSITVSAPALSITTVELHK